MRPGVVESQHEQRSAGWFQERVSLITGSKLSNFIGASPFTSPQKALDQFGKDDVKVNQTEAMSIGTAGEPYVIEKLEEIYDLVFYPSNLLICDELFGTSPDGLYITSDGRLGLLEIKISHKMNGADKIESATIPALSLYSTYYTQTTFSAAMIGASEIMIAVFVVGKFHIITFPTPNLSAYESVLEQLRSRLLYVKKYDDIIDIEDDFLSKYEEYVLPIELKSVVRIGDNFMSNCKRVDELFFPSLVHVGEGFLKNCASVKKLTVSKSMDEESLARIAHISSVEFISS